MPIGVDLQHLWEVRPTLRLIQDLPDQAAVESVRTLLDQIADHLRKCPGVSEAHVGIESGRTLGITATIALDHHSTPGQAVDLATPLLAEACAASGLATDMIKEVVVGRADIDPRVL